MARHVIMQDIGSMFLRSAWLDALCIAKAVWSAKQQEQLRACCRDAWTLGSPLPYMPWPLTAVRKPGSMRH